MMKDTYVAIMAGGVGSRFWPASKENLPKQFLDMLGTGKSLLRLTYERFLSVCDSSNIFIVTNKVYKDLVKEHIPELSDNQILLEPSRNNTAPCIAYASMKIHALNDNANLIVAPSDHIILKEQKFTEVLNEALSFVNTNNTLVTIGLEPTRPDTGYGYIQYEKKATADNIHKVKRFTEKPTLDKAQEFINSGDFVWNAGIFIWSTTAIMEALKKYEPSIIEILSEGESLFNTSAEQAFIDENYPKTPNISIDYAVMERADNIYTIPADLGWSDLGTWNSLHLELDKNENDNSILAFDSLLENVNNCLVKVKQKNKIAVIKNLHDFIIVDDDDVLLIWPKSDEQAIKAATATIKAKGLSEYL